MIAVLFADGSRAVHAESDLTLDCSNPENQDQPTVNRCAYDDLEAADDELNGVYRKALKAQAETDEMNPEHLGAVKELKKAERAWIEFRDAHCEAAAHGDIAGTAYPTILAGCKAQITRDRTKQLQDMIGGGK